MKNASGARLGKKIVGNPKIGVFRELRVYLERSHLGDRFNSGNDTKRIPSQGVMAMTLANRFVAN